MNTELPFEVSEYFKNGRKRAISVKPMQEFHVLVTFDDGISKLIDVNPPTSGQYAELRNRTVFDRVYIDDTGAIAWDIDENVDSSVYWNNHLDMCADNAYIYGKPIRAKHDNTKSS